MDETTQKYLDGAVYLIPRHAKQLRRLLALLQQHADTLDRKLVKRVSETLLKFDVRTTDLLEELEQQAQAALSNPIVFPETTPCPTN